MYLQCELVQKQMKNTFVYLANYLKKSLNIHILNHIKTIFKKAYKAVVDINIVYNISL